MSAQSPVRQLAAVHDLSGVGRTSLSVVIPILSTMGVKVCSLPTAVLSSHSRYEGFHFTDLTDQMKPIIEHWKQLGIAFDAVYSGFLGSHRQVSIVEEVIDTLCRDQSMVVTDPVLGDNGMLYSSVNKEMVAEMRRLIRKADIITPNLTEAALLLGESYPEETGEVKMKEWLLRLSEAGPGVVVITSVPQTGERKRFSVMAYNRRGNRFWRVPIDYVPADFPGTGDCFTSVLTGAMLQGDSLPVALDRAVNFISYGVRATLGYTYDQNQGIILERILNRLNFPMPVSSYEIL